MEDLLQKCVIEIKRLKEFLENYNNTGSQSCSSTISRINGKLEVYYEIIANFKPSQNKTNLKAMCCLGPNTPCPLCVNDGFCRAKKCQYRVEEIDE